MNTKPIAQGKPWWRHEKFLVLADQAVFSGGSFGITLWLAHGMMPHDFGRFASLVLVLYLIISVSNAIIVQPLQVSLASQKHAASYVAFAVGMQGIFTLVLCGSVAALLGSEIDLVKDYAVHAVGITVLTAGFVLHDFFRKLFLADAKIGQALGLDGCVVTLQAISFAVLFFQHALTLQTALVAQGIAYGSAAVLAFAWSGASRDWRAMEWKVFLHLHVQQGKWFVFTALVQWWSSNLFVVASGIFLGQVALGAFRLVQSMFGVLNILLQAFENYVLPQATRHLQVSHHEAKRYLRHIGTQGAVVFGGVLLVLFVFAEPVMQWAGGGHYRSYAFILRGMAVLYGVIFVGYPVRMAIRMLLLNKVFFIGYCLSFVFSLLTFKMFLSAWQLQGVIAGLIANQVILLCFWQYALQKKKFILWK
ncbi:hypothetical protein [Chryseolinea lacunae]|uniref:Polysaccharide biosynthesis protein n=1 Tax=Chryseolinea lacunae TaxID=2801331 RepID=A0ABS1L2S0_9BACT|nr:hypothetical protein [Chryseolinea lacunae]MBL0745838.1 hypothetical protein [Chryseolinea lacunae]